MKLFYTRKEVEEEINRAMIQRERDGYNERRIDSIVRDMSKLEERIQRLEMQSLEMKRFQRSGGIGGQGTLRPEFCNCNEEKR